MQHPLMFSSSSACSIISSLFHAMDHRFIIVGRLDKYVHHRFIIVGRLENTYTKKTINCTYTPFCSGLIL